MCQEGMKLSDLYFRKLSHLITEKHQVKPYITFGYYNDFSRIPDLSKRLFRKDPPDILIFQIRPAPVFMRSEVVISDYAGGFILNPLMKDRNNFERIESILGTKKPVMIHPHQLPFWKRMLVTPALMRNRKLGNLFGMFQRTKQALRDKIMELGAICKENNAQMYVIGCIPFKQPGRKEMLEIMNEYLKKELGQTGIHYIDFFPDFLNTKVPLFTKDKGNLNKEGHDVLVKRLFAAFQENYFDKKN